jgi:hypothetical protein
MNGRRLTVGYVAVLAVFSMAVGCRVVSAGFVVAVVSDTITEVQANRFEEMLAHRPASEADNVFAKNEKLPTWSDRLSTDRFLRYRAFGFGGVENFYAVRLSPDDAILDVSYWIEGSDGIEDLLKLAVMNPKVLNKPINRAESDASLEEPLFVFDADARSGHINVYDATNFTHLRPRLFVLDVDVQGVCQRARYYGIAGGKELRRREGKSLSTDGNVVKLNRRQEW